MRPLNDHHQSKVRMMIGLWSKCPSPPSNDPSNPSCFASRRGDRELTGRNHQQKIGKMRNTSIHLIMWCTICILSLEAIGGLDENDILDGHQIMDEDGSESPCFRIINPPPNYQLKEEDQTLDGSSSLEMLLRINCPGVLAATSLRLFTSSSNGAKGDAVWDTKLLGTSDELFSMEWNMGADYLNFHCSGWRQWLLEVEREDGAVEVRLMRVRVRLFEEALRDVERLAHSEGRLPVIVQIGAMDGASHDHLFPFLSGGGWKGLLVEPLGDHFDSLKRAYATAGDALIFEQVAVAEEAGERDMHRIARGREEESDAVSGFDGSSSLLTGENGFPPGMEMALKSMSPDFRQSVRQRMTTEKIRTERLETLLARHGVEQMDVFAVDTEGYDLEILSQLDPGVSTPQVIFMEIGLLSPHDKHVAVEMLKSRGYLPRVCGYGMEVLALLQDPLAA